MTNYQDINTLLGWLETAHSTFYLYLIVIFSIHGYGYIKF